MKKNRLEQMEQYIGENNTVKISDLASYFDISMSTLRRDLDKLAAEGIILKSYGCVSLAKPKVENPLLHSNSTVNQNEKKKIARFAAGLVENHDIIFIDSGSTCGLLTDYIPSEYHVTIVTNNLDIILRCMEKENLDIYLIPGKLNRKNNSISYMQDSNPYGDYNIGKVFVSCAGVDLKYGISHNEMAERIIKRYAIDRTLKRILLADSTKFDHVAPLHLCELSSFQTICTNKCPGDEYMKYCKEKHVQLIYE